MQTNAKVRPHSKFITESELRLFASPNTGNPSQTVNPKAIRPPFSVARRQKPVGKRIIECFPENYKDLTYCEPFGGGASVLLRKNPSKVEMYNDLNKELFNFFRVLREKPRELAHLLSLTLYSEDEFDGLDELPPTDDPVESCEGSTSDTVRVLVVVERLSVTRSMSRCTRCLVGLPTGAAASM